MFHVEHLSRLDEDSDVSRGTKWYPGVRMPNLKLSMFHVEHPCGASRSRADHHGFGVCLALPFLFHVKHRNDFAAIYWRDKEKACVA